MNSSNCRIAIATGTRAEWGLLSPLARALNALDGVSVSVIATNMHLNPLYGNTVDEIIADGLEVAARVPMNPKSDSEADTARAMAQCLSGMTDALDAIRPDALIILGDRYEMLAVASAATILRIPIIHIAGGETSLGAIDDQIRHAITQLSSLHLTETEPYRQRVIQMGKDPSTVINTGAIGVYNIMREEPMLLEELERSIDWQIKPGTLLVTLHPATADASADVQTKAQALIDALDRHPQSPLIITYPNNDARGQVIIDIINRYATRRGADVKLIPSLGRRRYLSALRYVAAVVGNSSSGIIEVPSAGIPTVNIGNRQLGRIAAPSVINADDDADSIDAAIAKALSPEFRAVAAKAVNPYFKPDTLDLMVKAICEFVGVD